MPNNRRPHPRRSALSIVVADYTLSEVRVVEIGTVPMTDEQHTAAVHALAALIATWRDTRTDGDVAGRQAA